MWVVVQAGLLVFGSKLNHSCVPNAVVELDAGGGGRPVSVRVTALQGISKGDAITVSYLQWHAEGTGEGWGRMDRQKQLRGRWGFECQCSKCEEER